jgi:hypothetical protein
MRDCLKLGNSLESLIEYKKSILEEIVVEKTIRDTEVKRAKALCEAHITVLQDKLEKVNGLIESKESRRKQ